MSEPESNRTFERQRRANVLAAFALALTDKINEAMLATEDRSLSSATALIQIRFNPGISIDQLKGMVGLTHSSMVRVVDQLVSDKLVVRQRREADSRVAVLNLTVAGQREAQNLLAARARIAEQLIDDRVLDGSIDLFSFIDQAIPLVVRPGIDQDIVCRFCDMASCPQDRCPVNICMPDIEKQ